MQRGSVTFATPGTYRYYCEFHATMKGTVTVVE
jgi:plastocyanin